MAFRPDFAAAPAAEFPNDNPALHRGVSWVCLAVTGTPRAIARPPTGTPPRSLAGPGPEGPRVRPKRVLEKKALIARHKEPAPASPNRRAEWVLAPALPWPDDVVTNVMECLAAPTLGAEPPRAAPAWTLAREIPWDDDTAQTVADWLAAAPNPSVDESSTPPAGRAPRPRAPAESEGPGLAKVRTPRPPSPEPARTAVAAPRPAATLMHTVPCESEPSGAAQPVVTDGHAAFVQVLVDIALAAGATRAAAVLPALMAGEPVEAKWLEDAVVLALETADVLQRDGSTLGATRTFARTTQAWRDVLRGASEDFSACGTSTLDDWAASLLVALGVTAQSTTARKELRRRGVAAFGMRVAA